MSDALLDDIIANPDDDSLRAVWADRLLDAGDAWGEFIHLQLALARGGDTLRPTHEPRLRELYNELAHSHDPAPSAATQWVWRRGFLDHVMMTSSDFQASIYETAPLLRTLETSVGQVIDGPVVEHHPGEAEALTWFAELLADPKVQKLEGLIVRAQMSFQIETGEVGFWGQIETASENVDIGDRAIEILAGANLPRLHMLGISALTRDGLSVLASSPLAARLDRLVAPWLTADQLRWYLDHPNTGPLRGLICHELIEHPKLARLEEVSTSVGPLSPAGIRRSQRSDGGWENPRAFDDWVFRSIYPV